MKADNEVTLGSEAIEYLRAELSEGKTLSKLLLNSPLEGGRIVTYLPSGFPPAARTDFSSGGVTSYKKTIEWLNIKIEQYLSTNGAGIFESALARVGDPFLLNSNIHYFSMGEEVYYTIIPRDENHGNPAKILHHAAVHRLVGVLAALPDLDSRLAQTKSVDLEFLKLVAERTDFLILGAYDGEGALLWSHPRFSGLR